MVDLFDALRILFLIVFAVSANIIYLVIYNILTEKGYSLSGFRIHINNLLDFSDLIRKTADLKEKRRYNLLLRSFILMLVLLLGTALTYLIDIGHNGCREYANFLKREVHGQVVDKFVDTHNHNSAALKIIHDEEVITNFDLTTGQSNFYDSIEIGDHIKKLRGDSVVYILRGGRKINFIKTKKDFCAP